MLALLLVAGVGTAAYAYNRLNSNITSTPLFAGATGNAGKEPVDAFGDSAINLLVIGSDSRASAANCSLGGDCSNGPSANADVELLVHVAADRSNATVMSIPRDTVTALPACHGSSGAAMSAHVGQINSTLTFGAGCTVAAVHQLTGIPIDHVAVVDFAGVVAMSDAVGGVPVCVSADVYDPYSHLKLTKGAHSLTGVAALEFLRSRHAFGDGSDLGRSDAQHQFLGSLLRTVRSAGTLANPARLYSLAQAATQALTVDPGLDSISKLVSLARDLNRVPADRITFVTMPNALDPANPNRVVPAAEAKALFSKIAEDHALTPAPASRAASTSPPGAASGSAGSSVSGPAPGETGSSAAASPSSEHALLASQSGGCTQVSQDRTVVVNGVAMTPTQAFNASPSVKPSAP